ncbi:MAG: hypothetical protein AB7Q30_13075 [Vicinamibacteria bacterium]
MPTQLDPTKPPTGGDFISADHRANFAAIQAALGNGNALADYSLECWPAGDTTSPAHFTLAGAGAAIQRCGVGLADTRAKHGDFCARITSGGGAAATFDPRLLSSGSFHAGLRGVACGCGCGGDAGAASSGRGGRYDGVGTTWADKRHAGDLAWTTAITHHPGDAAWWWLAGARTLDAAATEATWRVEAAAGTVVAYVSAAALALGPSAPAYPQPSREGRLFVGPGTQQGDLVVGTYINGWRLSLPMPAVLRRVDIYAGTAPATQAAIWDANKNGSSAYSTRPQIAAAAAPPTGGAAPDGTYANRCFARGDVLSLDQDQIGTGTTGADATAVAEFICWPRPFEAFRVPTEVN